MNESKEGEVANHGRLDEYEGEKIEKVHNDAEAKDSNAMASFADA